MSVSSKNLKDQVAIITGASTGIGRAIAIALGEQGARCVLAARREAELKKTAEAVEKAGGKALVVPTDVFQESQLENLIDTTVKEWGEIRVLVNNAGTYHRALVEELHREQIDQVLGVNLVAPMVLTRLALPHLKKQSGSAVINIASIAGVMGFAKGSVYSASKHGLIGFTESLYEEVREFGMKVCAICPGFVKTPMVEGRGLIDENMIPPEDVGKMVVDILTFSEKSCPIRIILRPQCSPYPK